MNNNLVSNRDLLIKSGLYRKYIKRLFDIVIGLFGTLLCFFPLAIIISCCYMVGRDKGPILFRQDRMGLNGKTFKILKFRSMVVNAEEVLKEDKELYQKYLDNGYKLHACEDPRLTKIGRFIRKTSLDEFPQFINILKGDMSFIGPRPILSYELHEYSPAQQALLFSVLPGATGWWQVSGRSDVFYPERADLQVYYPQHISFALDVKILFLTIKQVILGEGAR